MSDHQRTADYEWRVRPVEDLAAGVYERRVDPWSDRTEWVLAVNPAEYTHITDQRLQDNGSIVDSWTLEMHKALRARFGQVVPTLRLLVSSDPRIGRRSEDG